MSEEEWLTAQEVADLKTAAGEKVTRRAVYDAIHTLKLRAKRRKGQWLVERASVGDWVIRRHR